MPGPRALLAAGTAAVVPLVLLAGPGLLSTPSPLRAPAVSAAPTGQVLLVRDPGHPGQLVLQGYRSTAPREPRGSTSIGGPGELTLAVSGLLVLAGAATSACAGGRGRVRVA